MFVLVLGRFWLERGGISLVCGFDLIKLGKVF